MSGRADHHRVEVDGDRGAELVVLGAVGGGQLGLLRPDRPAAHEDVGGAGPHLAGDVVELRADQSRGPGECDGRTEEVAGGAVGGGQLLPLRPHAVDTDEEVGGADALLSRGGIARSTDERHIAEKGDRGAEEHVGSAVVGGEHLQLRPGAAGAREDVGGAGGVAPARGADQRRVAVDGDRETERVRAGDGRGEHGLLQRRACLPRLVRGRCACRGERAEEAAEERDAQQRRGQRAAAGARDGRR